MHKTTRYLPFLLVAACALCAWSAHATAYYWIGGASGNWDDGNNWSLTDGGAAAGDFPVNAGDKARFAATAGTVTLKATTDGTTLNCDIEIPQDVTLDFVTNARQLNITGSITGKGTLSARSDTSSNTYRGLHLEGDNSEFGGTVKIYSHSNQQRDQHDLTGAASSSNATWRVYVDGVKNLGAGPFRTNDQTYYLGAAQVKFYKPNSGGYTGSSCTFEVGALDIDSSFSAVDSNAKYGSTCKLRWIAPTATLTHDVGNLQILEVCGGGTAVVGDTYGLPQRIKFTGNGGTLKTAVDPSAVLTQSEVAICYDDEGTNRTWATALDSSNAGGFTKKGTGALTLSVAPAWTSAQTITVLDGQLVVNDASFANYTLGAGTKVATVGSTLVFSPDAQATVTFADTATYTLALTVGDNPISSGDNVGVGETLVIAAQAAQGFTVTSILVNGVAIDGNEYTVAAADVEGGVAVSATTAILVAKIGDKEYASLEDAVEEAVDGDEIVLCSNVVLDKNLEIADGVTVAGNEKTITLGEYGVYYEDGYHELGASGDKIYLRTAYVWNGGTSGTWTDSSWLVNGAASSAPAESTAVVVIPAAATIAMNGGRTGQLFLEANVTLTGTLTVDVIKGTGKVTFNGTTLNEGSGQQVYCDACFTGSINANTASLSFYGKFTGDAQNISFTSSGSYTPGFKFYGDASEFTGLYTGGRANNNARDNTKFYNKGFDGSAGSWDFDRNESNNDGYAFKGGDNAVYKFGWLKNEKFTFASAHYSTGDTIAKNSVVEIGAVANKTSTIIGTLSDDSNTLRKIGATSGADVTLNASKGTVEVVDGTVTLLSTNFPTTVKGVGGTLSYSPADLDAENPSKLANLVVDGSLSLAGTSFDATAATLRGTLSLANDMAVDSAEITGDFTLAGGKTLTLAAATLASGVKLTMERGAFLVLPKTVAITKENRGANTRIVSETSETITLGYGKGFCIIIQ